MLRPIIAICVLAGVAHACPSHATQEAPLVKAAEKIKLYCGNPQLAFVIDWPAFENLDIQLLIDAHCVVQHHGARRRCG